LRNKKTRGRGKKERGSEGAGETRRQGAEGRGFGSVEDATDDGTFGGVVYRVRS
jgi:hypothetical protein